jgi:hypothetical protein
LRYSFFAINSTFLQRSVKRAKADRCGSISLDPAVSVLDRLAVCPGHRETGDGDRLAPQRVSAVLDLEGAPRPGGTAACLPGNAEPDSPEISCENPLWGAPRIHGELLKLGIDIGETSVGKYMARSRKPPSQGRKSARRTYARPVEHEHFHEVSPAAGPR